MECLRESFGSLLTPAYVHANLWDAANDGTATWILATDMRDLNWVLGSWL